MADLGTKPVGVATEPCSFKYPWYTSPQPTKTSSPWLSRGVRIGMLQGVAVPGTFYGSVTEANTPVPNAVVRVYERATGYFVVETRTAADGTFTIPNQRQASSDYYVVALDPEGGALYNALIYDRVAPV